LAPVFLSLAEVIEIHRDQIGRHGGHPGIRDFGLLAAAVAAPQATMGGKYLHTDLFEMATAYLFHIVRNHPFVDGNKRAGAVVALVFLELNGVETAPSDDDLVDIVLSVAQGRTQKDGVASFLRRYAEQESASTHAQSSQKRRIGF
jgi:death-on-curing protein